MENINGKMGEFFKDNGKIIKCMEKGNLNGLMEECTSDNMF